MHAPALLQLLHRHHPPRVDPPLVDPPLDAIDVDRAHVLGEHVDEAAGAVRDGHRGLSAGEVGRDVTVLFLAFVAAAGRLAFAGGGTAAEAFASVGVAFGGFERREEGEGADLRRGEHEFGGEGEVESAEGEAGVGHAWDG